ncbi:uncharacterized protein LOC110010873 [Jatropha curcas]|uniref:uncharacterized protein LOC110010873 n=1 Tax=Jatropha curcas TaxID=180498 RepID=UPI0009D7077F|nr:uncharacterized protein LOC110010873 [Jatropha curcas]
MCKLAQYRLIQDNILLAFEIIRSMKHRTNGNASIVELKINISKAYNRVDWDFLKNMLIHMGFSSKWVHCIMICITSVKYSVLCNDEIVGPIIPERGLSKQQSEGGFMGVGQAGGNPRISHLLFADDSIFFFKANKRESQKAIDNLKSDQVEEIIFVGWNLWRARSSLLWNNEVQSTQQLLYNIRTQIQD